MTKNEISDVIDKLIKTHVDTRISATTSGRAWGDNYYNIASLLYSETINNASNITFIPPKKDPLVTRITDYNKLHKKAGTANTAGRIAILKE